MTPGNAEDLFELSKEIAEVVSGSPDVADTGNRGPGAVIRLRFEGGEGGDTRIVANDYESDVVISGLDILPDGGTSEIQGLEILFDRKDLEGDHSCCSQPPVDIKTKALF